MPVNGGPKQVDESRQQRQAKAVLSLESDSIGFGSVPVGRSQISKVKTHAMNIWCFSPFFFFKSTSDNLKVKDFLLFSY